ncbi:MAG: histidine phosphatase family protein [Pseudomonadota bacterium]
MAEAQLILIRHARADTQGRLAGRRDVPAILDDAEGLARLRGALGSPAKIVTSPALRCRQTANALFGERAGAEDDRLWEQDFGDHEGVPFEDIPDLGPLPRADLATVTPPGGEGFADMVARVTPALRNLAGEALTIGPIVVVAHAGTVRAGLALALGDMSAALAFEVEPLSATRIRCLPGAMSVMSVNHVA